jgi:hypothetical protein
MYDRLERDRRLTRAVLAGLVVFYLVLFFLPGDQPPWLALGGTGLACLALTALRWRADLRPGAIATVLGVLALGAALYTLTGNRIVLFHPAIPATPTLIAIGLLILIYGETFFEGRIT